MTIVYARETSLGADEYIAVLSATTMRTKRPLANRQRIAAMLEGANFVVTAREDGVLVGLARCLSDDAWVCYCAELAVREDHQGKGIGRGILECCYDLLGPGMGLILAAESEAVAFYERIGMDRVPYAFFHPRTDRT